MPPSGTQTIVAVTIIVRRRAGVYSAVIVVAVGNAPPMPRPATKRSAAIVSTLCASPIAQVAAPNRNTLPSTAPRRPKRSATSPAQALPIPIPISPAATAGAKAPRVMPHSLISTGIAKPISWPSKPSSTIESAASSTTHFCIVVNGPSSSVAPMSTAGAVASSRVLMRASIPRAAGPCAGHARRNWGNRVLSSCLPPMLPVGPRRRCGADADPVPRTPASCQAR